MKHVINEWYFQALEVVLQKLSNSSGFPKHYSKLHGIHCYEEMKLKIETHFLTFWMSTKFSIYRPLETKPM